MRDRRLIRARAEWAAARACLRDRRAGIEPAETHLLSACAALLAADEALPEPADLPRMARTGVDAPWTTTLSSLADELSGLIAGPHPRRRVRRRRARRLLAILAPVVVGPRRGRARLAIAAATCALALAAVVALRGRPTQGIGFHGRYFPRRAFGGAPQTRTDARIDFTWLGHAPLSGMPADQFSVRWDGCFELVAEEVLGFRVGSDDGSRVFLDGKSILDNWRDQGGNWVQREMRVDPGRHHLRVEYYERGGDAFVVFELSRDGAPVADGFVWPPTALEPEVSCDAD